MKTIKILFVLFISLTLNAQDMQTDKLPYYEIPDAAESYTSGTVVARMIDGLGFRYYWATEGLRAEDLNYEPGNRVRTSNELINHIYGLSKVIVNAATKTENIPATTKVELTFEEKRKKTLENFQKASNILSKSTDLTEFNVVFKNENGTNTYPFWNNINGPIADAIWHSGQVAMLRRSSGNPFNGKASVFTGKVRK